MDEGWWLLLADPARDELLALKRVAVLRVGTMTTTLAFLAPLDPGAYTFSVHLVSDTYVGVDQECAVAVTVQPGTPPGDGDDDGGDEYDPAEYPSVNCTA